MLPPCCLVERPTSGSTPATVERLRSKVTPFPDVGRHMAAMVQRYPVTAAVIEGAAMQVNEFVGRVKQGTRRPDMDRAFDDERATLESRPERRGADESRRTAEPTRMPPRYGAGF